MTSVILYVSEVTTHAVLFRVVDIVRDNTLADRLTVDEVFAHEDWKIVDTYDSNIAPIYCFYNQHKLIDDLATMRKQIDDLYRHPETSDEPIAKLERRIRVQCFMIKAMFKATLGVWPFELAQLGIY